MKFQTIQCDMCQEEKKGSTVESENIELEMIVRIPRKFSSNIHKRFKHSPSKYDFNYHYDYQIIGADKIQIKAKFDICKDCADELALLDLPFSDDKYTPRHDDETEDTRDILFNALETMVSEIIEDNM